MLWCSSSSQAASMPTSAMQLLQLAWHAYAPDHSSCLSAMSARLPQVLAVSRSAAVADRGAAAGAGGRHPATAVRAQPGSGQESRQVCQEVNPRWLCQAGAASGWQPAAAVTGGSAGACAATSQATATAACSTLPFSAQQCGNALHVCVCAELSCKQQAGREAAEMSKAEGSKQAIYNHRWAGGRVINR